MAAHARQRTRHTDSLDISIRLLRSTDDTFLNFSFSFLRDFDWTIDYLPYAPFMCLRYFVLPNRLWTFAEIEMNDVLGLGGGSSRT